VTGKLRLSIVASSTKVICTAFLADASSNPPASMTALSIVARTKQKPAN
jgi:hypothetical protein